ncbi:type IX secretion system sortase PorU [Chitinophaga qingshengii]|uniref:Type IX secretion system sortase PorU n=1 Tax=Chitinophaga qingshengii TaxID=1569794 RepID=A0ABR7TWA6_9BACT|nr:type IX secretion system sortase PorU [Chitinophaga qingshengii]MBC9933898.1 type IX secretion system sortase PorU [Chitinophaga qingshengii]
MKPSYIFPVLLLFFLYHYRTATGQTVPRTYKDHSVLASGHWYKLSVAAPGIYKIDISLLQQLGIDTRQLASGSIRLFGTGGQLLPEPNSQPRYDDLPEVSLQAQNGGDGQLDGNDYLLFYAPGPHRWQWDPLKPGFTHQYNLYSDVAYYFLTIGENGARIRQDNNTLPADNKTAAFDYHTFYERDSLNFLSSGKQWWGQEFSKVIGNSRSYGFSLPALPLGPVTVGFRAAARGATGSNFSVSLNQTTAASAYLLPVGGSVFEAFATAATGAGQAAVTNASLDVGVTFQPGDLNAKGWLDYLELTARCPLKLPAGGMLDFRCTTPVGRTQYFLANAAAQTQVWEVSNPLMPLRMATRLQADTLIFTGEAGPQREFIAFNANALLRPVPAGAIANQDLHGLPGADLLIVTCDAFLAEAERLAAWRRSHDGLSVNVVTATQVFNEFGAGTPDPTAIRDYVKMYYDRGDHPKYLLLFGAASYDYRQRLKNNTNLVPSWQSEASLDAIHSYVSDDFFGFLDDAEDITRTDIPNLLDIGIGRLPARNNSEAKMAVDKIIRYQQPAAFGPWRNRATLLADDEDDNLHLEDAEAMGNIIFKNNPLPNISKIYIDAYPQENTSAGVRSPEVTRAVNTNINNGTLVLNYSGHGSNNRLAEETVMDQNSVRDWKNEQQLPLLITATCDFAPFDDPGINSLGAQLLLQQQSGAIALMTTTRAVFANSNRIMNANYLEAAFTPQAGGAMRSLGAAIQEGKNKTYRTSGDVVNNRKFQLLGDPSLMLAFPKWQVVTDSVNGRKVTTETDTLKGLQHCIIKGHIADAQGNILRDYNGTLTATVYDQPVTHRTRGNDPRSRAADFQVQENVLFKGTQTVQQGEFTMAFTVPADLLPGKGKGKISYYTSNAIADGGGYFDGFMTGGTLPGVPADVTGPDVKVWLDSKAFINGDMTGPSPLLMIDLADSNGINVSGSNPAHSLVAILDSSEYLILNDYFEASLDSYREGQVRFPLAGLTTGPHHITIKAWDTYNNSTVKTIRFKVATPGSLTVDEVVNYPNPFYDVTRFSFLHNQQGQQLQVDLQIFSIDGKLVKKMRSTIFSGTSRFDGIPWDGKGDSGARLPAGIYIYRLIIGSNDQTRALGGKMVLL